MPLREGTACVVGQRPDSKFSGKPYGRVPPLALWDGVVFRHDLGAIDPVLARARAAEVEMDGAPAECMHPVRIVAEANVISTSRRQARATANACPRASVALERDGARDNMTTSKCAGE